MLIQELLQLAVGLLVPRAVDPAQPDLEPGEPAEQLVRDGIVGRAEWRAEIRGLQRLGDLPLAGDRLVQLLLMPQQSRQLG